MPDEAYFDRRDLVRQLRDLGVGWDDALVVHCSFRAVRPVRGGTSALIAALLDAVDPSGTLVMPSMTNWDDERVFDLKATPCRDLGVVADTF